jgi:hypothetical protein
MKAMLGPLLLHAPYMFAQAGLAFASAMLLLVGLLSTVCSHSHRPRTQHMPPPSGHATVGPSPRTVPARLTQIGMLRLVQVHDIVHMDARDSIGSRFDSIDLGVHGNRFEDVDSSCAYADIGGRAVGRAGYLVVECTLVLSQWLYWCARRHRTSDECGGARVSAVALVGSALCLR